MATVSGTVTGVNLLRAHGDYKWYELTSSFAVYTASSDSAAIAAVPTAINNFTKNGKTVTLLSAITGPPGKNATGVDVFASSTVTVDGATLEFDLGSGVTTEANTSASTGVGIVVAIKES